MGYKVSFMDDTSYQPDDINNINTNLLSLSETGFVTGQTIGVDELNAITANMIEKGISQQNDKFLTTINKEMQTVVISSGIAFFSTGITLKMDVDGAVLSYAEDVENYVYLYYSAAYNVCEPRCTTSYPDDGEYITLYEISSDGELKDIRQYASMKNSSILPNKNYKTDVTIICTEGYTEFTKEVKLDDTGYTKVFLSYNYMSGIHETYFSLYLNVEENVGVAYGDDTGALRGSFGKRILDKSSIDLELPQSNYIIKSINILNDTLIITFYRDSSAGGNERTLNLEVM